MTNKFKQSVLLFDLGLESKDLKSHCYWSDRLLDHYFRTLSDRQIYWLARERAKSFGDLLVMAIDSYDKAKVTVPRRAFGRTPKKPIYEQTHRELPAMVKFKICFPNLFKCLFFFTWASPSCPPLRFIDDAYRVPASWNRGFSLHSRRRHAHRV